RPSECHPQAWAIRRPCPPLRRRGPRSRGAREADLVFERCHRHSVTLVLVVPADPVLPRFALVAALWRAVEDPVVAHQELDAAARGRVGLVHGAAVEDECAEAPALAD